MERQLGRIAKMIHRRGVGSLSSFTETNPRGLEHAITTRRGLNYNPPKNPLKKIHDTQNKTTKNISTKEGTPDSQKIINEISSSLIPFPRRLKKEKEKEQFQKFFENLQRLSINIPFIEALEQMPKLNLGELKPTHMYIKLADKSTQIVRGIAENVIVKIDRYLQQKNSFKVGDETIIFDIEKSMRFLPSDDDTCHSVDIIDLSILNHISEDLEHELVPTRTVNGWRVCIDYRKLNDAIRKDHFPLPFIYQMLERLSGNEYYCFLDGFSGYFQIPLAPEDQEKTTFTCPYMTFDYRRMPFGLCNAPVTFQRYMIAIFHDMCKDFMEVFMDDFSIFGNSFNSYLNNLSKMLARCEETNLVLN
ncbi:reverse transcriptase domain-containing protein [Tanacetum coccineum]